MKILPDSITPWISPNGPMHASLLGRAPKAIMESAEIDSYWSPTMGDYTGGPHGRRGLGFLLNQSNKRAGWAVSAGIPTAGCHYPLFTGGNQWVWGFSLPSVKPGTARRRPRDNEALVSSPAAPWLAMSGRGRTWRDMEEVDNGETCRVILSLLLEAPEWPPITQRQVVAWLYCLFLHRWPLGFIIFPYCPLEVRVSSHQLSWIVCTYTLKCFGAILLNTQ